MNIYNNYVKMNNFKYNSNDLTDNSFIEKSIII